MHKKFTFGLIALLGVSLFILGCDDRSDESTQAAEQAAEALAKKDTFQGKVDVDGATVTLKPGQNITIAEAITVEDGVKLVVPAGGTLTVGAGGSLAVAGSLEVPGTVTVNTTVTLAAGKTIKVTGQGKVTLGSNLELVAGTFTGQGTNGVKFDGATSAIIAGNGTATAVGDGLLIGTAADGVKLLSSGTSASTASFAASVAKTTIGGITISVAVTPGTLTDASTQEFTVGATGSIVLGTTSGGVDVGNSGQLILGIGAKIGVFADTSSASELVADTGNDAIAFTKTDSSNGAITAKDGTLTVSEGSVTHTGGTSGTSIDKDTDINAASA
jgi:hypothetical protein